MSATTIPDQTLTALVEGLDRVNAGASDRVVLESHRSQPIHTVYGGAHLFASSTFGKLAQIARRSLQEYAPDAKSLAEALGYEPELARHIHPRLVDKLEREPLEDYRIDFEDGFGWRSDEEEDRVAIAAGRELAAAIEPLPRSLGIRVKPLTEESKRRSLRTFDLFLSALLEAGGGRLLDRIVITLPKITAAGQVATLASACDAFEYWAGLPEGSLRLELMVETPQAVINRDGVVALPRLVAEGRGRVSAAHFGPYDYTAACDITAAHQDLQHPACDFARRIMQVALAGTGIWMSDGPTMVMPIAPHRAGPGGTLTAAQRAENRLTVHHAWRLHVDNVRKALVAGFYQGWDLHPAQVPARYAAVYAFFLEGLDVASQRLRNFIEHAGQATRVGNVFDDAATGQGLLNFFLRAQSSGAISEEDAVNRSGLTIAEIRSRSFASILSGRFRQSYGA
jgi:citrate lyase beta subunit